MKNKFLRSFLSIALCCSLIAAPITTIAAEADENTDSNPQITVSVTVTPNEDGSSTEQTTKTESWNNQNTEGQAPDQQSAPVEGSSSVTTTTTSGSETTVSSTTTDEQSRVINESESVTGSETTTINKITTTVDIQENQTVVDTTTTTTTENGNVTSVVKDGQVISTGQAGPDATSGGSSSTGWIEGSTPKITGDEATGWTEGNVSYKDAPDQTIDPAAKESTSALTVPDPLDTSDVTLTMTPGGTDTEKVSSTTVGQLAAANIQMPEFKTTTDDVTDQNGNKIGTTTTTTSPIKSGSDVIGWETTTTIVTENETGRSVSETVPEAESGYEIGAPAAVAPVLPADIKAGEEPVYDADGNVIGKIVTEITNSVDANHNPITIVTKTTTINSSKTETPVPGAIADTTEGPTEQFVLPQKPAASESTDSATGNTTTVTVEDIVDSNGKHVGYRSITVVKDQTGRVLSKNTDDIYGTDIKTSKTTSTSPTGSEVTTNSQTTTTEVTTYNSTETRREVELETQRYVELQKKIETSKEYQYIQVGDKLYFVYTAEMGTPYNDKGHGQISNVDNVSPDMSLVNGSGGVNLTDKDLYKKNDAQNGNYGSQKYVEVNSSYTGDYEYQLVGNGLASLLEVATKNDSTIVHQFKLVDDEGNAFYAYCVDMSVDVQVGYDYKLDEVNERTEGGYKEDGTNDPVENLTRIALNGYWGTTDGVGSIKAVRQFLDESGYDDQYDIDADDLTEGQAVAATQAAIWKYGNSGSSGVDEAKMLADGSSDSDVKFVKALYYALLNAKGTALLDADDITGSSITIKEKTGENTYNTDVGFTLDANASELAGDLMVNIMNGTQVIKSAVLSGYQNSNADYIFVNSDGSYTIQNVELPEGVKITLNISGLQQSATGVKIYVSEIVNSLSSQTLIGLTKGNRNVDINVDLNFDVQEPVANLVSGTDEKKQLWNTTRTDTRTDIRTDKKTDTFYSTTTNVVNVEEVNTKVFATVTITEITEENTKRERSWESSWSNSYSYEDPVPYNDDYPLKETKKQKNTLIELTDEEIPLGSMELVELYDEMVPLASIPRTGDHSPFWKLTALLSTLGLIVLHLTDKKKKA